MDKKEEKSKENRFTYSNNDGVKVLSEKEIVDSIKNQKESDKVEKSVQNDTWERWL